MCMAVSPPKEPPKTAKPGSLANPSGFDFTGLTDAQFQEAKNVSGDQLNYMTAEAQARRAEAIQKEIDRRDAPRRLAEERKALAAQMQSESVALQRQMTEQRAQQEAKVEELQGLQNERIAGIRSRGTAVTQSLQILARDGGQAPTATMSSRSSQRAGARSTTAGLRMGTTRRGTGSGSNLSV